MLAYIKTVLALAKAYLLRFFRDKTAMFFTFLFPLLFLLVFGSLNSNNNDISFDVALLNKSESGFSRQFVDQLKDSELFEVDENIKTLPDARERLGRGEIDGIIELPVGFGDVADNGRPSGQAVTYYQKSSPQSGQTIATLLEGVLDEYNRQLGQPEPPLGVEQKAADTTNLSPFDYVFAGLLGFTLLSLGIFGLANQMPAEKKTGSLKRLKASPLTSGQLIFANMLYYLLIGLVSVVLMFIVATLLFDFSMQGDWLSLAVWIVLGIVMMFGFGLAIGGWAKNENQSAALSNLVSFPLMFLSGVFFPRFLMPEWLQGITNYLPLTPVIDGLRMIMNEGKTVLELGPELGLIALWTVAVYTIAIRVFRWQ